MWLLLALCFGLAILSEGVLHGKSMANTLTQILSTMQKQCSTADLMKDNYEALNTKLESQFQTTSSHAAKLAALESSVDASSSHAAKISALETRVDALSSDGSLINIMLKNTLAIKEIQQ